jgi:hypothetical protein
MHCVTPHTETVEVGFHFKSEGEREYDLGFELKESPWRTEDSYQ